MSLTTGQIKYYYPTKFPQNNTGAIGGTVGSTQYANSTTGVFLTGSSDVAGAGSNYYYSKLFIKHEGATGDFLYNPSIYVANEYVTDQIHIAADPYWIAGRGYTGQSNEADNRLSLPDDMYSSDFKHYTQSNPMSLVALNPVTGSITIASGNSIGVWLRLQVVDGLESSFTNNFNLVLRGDI